MTDSLTEWILRYESGKIFFNKLVSEVTKRLYLKRLKDYCDAVGKNPDELIALKIEGLKHVGEPNEYQAENLLETYLSTAKLTMNMKDGAKTAIMSFYTKNRRRLEPDTAENIDKPESKKRCPKVEDLLELDNAMTTLRDKALLWFVASAPFRLSSITKLKWKDLKPTGDNDVPYYMLIEGARLKGAGVGKYKGVKQMGFLHSLASQKLDSYKKELERKNYKITEDSPIFIPYRQEGIVKSYSPWSIEPKFTDASLKAWHDLDKKRFSPHDLRSFVQTALENAGINPNIIAPILGHKVKGVDFHYSEHEMSDCMEKFKTALPYLLPQSIEKVKAEHDQKIKVQDQKIKETLDNLAGISEALAQLQKKHPEITLEDLREIKNSIQQTTQQLNGRMNKIMKVLASKFPELSEQA